MRAHCDMQQFTVSRPSHYCRRHLEGCNWSNELSAVLNFLPASVLDSDSLAIFKSKLKTHLFNITYSELYVTFPPAPVRLWQYGAIQTRILYLLLCHVFVLLFLNNVISVIGNVANSISAVM